MEEKLEKQGLEIGENPIDEQPENQTRWPCHICKHFFSSKRAMEAHMDNGACLGKGFVCLRCYKMWFTQSDLKKHQSAIRKCNKRKGCTIQKLNKMIQQEFI